MLLFFFFLNLCGVLTNFFGKMLCQNYAEEVYSKTKNGLNLGKKSC